LSRKNKLSAGPNSFPVKMRIMPFHKSGGIRYFKFDSFDHPSITHAVFTRKGGFSPKPWDSLNMGALVGDDRKRVDKNRILAFRTMGRDPESIYDVWQVHSAEVVNAEAPRPPDVPHIKSDAILTNNPKVTLFMRFADCVPILLFDPAQRVVGLVHAGWQGTVKKVVAATVNTMVKSFGSQPAKIQAGIGPSIAAHHYQVGPEVVDKVYQAFGDHAEGLLPSQDGAVQFDLWAANRILLRQVGVEQIETSNLCTACHLEDWFSHRAEDGKTGRFGVLIGLND
jgi:YfiH family protein